MTIKPMLLAEKLPGDDGIPFIIYGDHIEVKEDAKLKPEEYQMVKSQQKKIDEMSLKIPEIDWNIILLITCATLGTMLLVKRI